MHKKPSHGKNKTATQKPTAIKEPKVLSLIGKLEKKTEKQMAGFVKELVRLKKQQVKLEQKLVKNKEHTVKAKKKTVTVPLKKKNIRKFKLVENKSRNNDEFRND